MAWNRSGEGRMVYYPYDMGTGKEAGLHTSNIYVDIVNLNSTLYMNGNNIENANSIKVNRINNTNFDDWKSDVNSELSSLSRRISALENKSSAE